MEININKTKKLDNCLQFLENHLLSGNCLVAELYRISLTTPNDFLDYPSSPYAKLLTGFSYFENPDSLDKFVEQAEVSKF